MGELEKKGGRSRDQELETRKKRDLDGADEDEKPDAEDELQLLPWDADVDRFLEMLEHALNDFRTSMSSSEFRTLVLRYRDLTPTEKRAIANRLQRRRLGNFLRALHAGDYSLYLEGWEMEAKTQGGDAGPRPDTP